MEEYIFNISGEEIQERLDAVPNKADKDSAYTKTEIDTKLADKADKNSVYTKTETDTKLDNKADKNSVYTKTETDTKLAGKADKNSVYTKTETDTKLADKADKNSVYTKTETNNLLANKADKASTLAGYGINDAYTKTQVDGALRLKAGTDVYQMIDDVDKDRQAAVFGKITDEQIEAEEGSYGGGVDEFQIYYSTVLGTFVYHVEEFGNVRYYQNWLTKKHYVGADSAPYYGKTYYCGTEDKMYYFDSAEMRETLKPAVLPFRNIDESDFELTMGSYGGTVSPQQIVFSTALLRFVYRVEDGLTMKYYDNWSTRNLYNDKDTNEARAFQLYYSPSLEKIYIYDSTNGYIVPVTPDIDMSVYLKNDDHALTEFITAGQEATVVDYASIFGNNTAEISKMHWMYFIRMQQTVVGFMDVQVSYAGNIGKIRITERLRTRALLSDDKKSIVWSTSEWNEDHEYTRFILSYDDMSQGIRAGEWTAWYEVPKLTIAEKQKIGNVYTKTEVDRLVNNVEFCQAGTDEDVDLVPGRTYVIPYQRTFTGGTIKAVKGSDAITTVFLKKADGAIKLTTDGSTVTRGIPTAAGEYELKIITDAEGHIALIWTKLDVFS